MSGVKVTREEAEAFIFGVLQLWPDDHPSVAIHETLLHFADLLKRVNDDPHARLTIGDKERIAAALAKFEEEKS